MLSERIMTHHADLEPKLLVLSDKRKRERATGSQSCCLKPPSTHPLELDYLLTTVQPTQQEYTHITHTPIHTLTHNTHNTHRHTHTKGITYKGRMGTFYNTHNNTCTISIILASSTSVFISFLFTNYSFILLPSF